MSHHHSPQQPAEPAAPLAQVKPTEPSPAANPAAAKPVPPVIQPPVAAVLSPKQIEELQSRAAKADENWERLLRTTADLDNYKKRAAREKIESAQYAVFSLLQKLLPVLDNFEMALAAAQTAHQAHPDATKAGNDKLASLQSGIVMVQQQLKAALTEAGLEEIDAAGQPFDPNLHEAIAHQESADTPEGHVSQQLRKGYKFKERLLRPATVMVAKKPEAKS
jgi:molecular chaperone GrpE